MTAVAIFRLTNFWALALLTALVILQDLRHVHTRTLDSGRFYQVSHRTDRTGYKVYRIVAASESQQQFLDNLYLNSTEYDFWVEPSYVGHPVEVMVPPAAQPVFEHRLFRQNMPFTILVQDVERLIRTEEFANHRKREGGATETSDTQQTASAYRYSAQVFYNSIVPGFALDQYHSYNEISEFITQLNALAPSITTLMSIGTSYEGRPLRILKVAKAGDLKPVILIDAGIHAREWIAPATATYIANELVSKYNTDAKIKDLVDSIDWYIMPVVNPDGYEYSRTTDRMWRKTRSRQCTGWNCCYGVDPNRNFDFNFGGTGSSANTCSEIHRGKTAFSEPETRALSKFILSIKDSLMAYITLHSYGQDWLIPYGHKRNARPPDYKELFDVARDGAQALRKSAGTRYRVGNTVDLLYPASGGSDDWAKGVAGIKYVYTIELRPTNRGGGFVLRPSEIIPTGNETFEGIKIVANKIVEENYFFDSEYDQNGGMTNETLTQ